MLPVGPCISWVNDYTNEYWYRVKNKVFQCVYRIDCYVYWNTFVKFSIIVDILLIYCRSVGTHISCMQSASGCLWWHTYSCSCTKVRIEPKSTLEPLPLCHIGEITILAHRRFPRTTWPWSLCNVYRVDCNVYWKTFVKFSIIVDILLTFHMMRRHITGNEASQAVGMLQAGQVQRAIQKYDP
jgi:hypothetical protein